MRKGCKSDFGPSRRKARPNTNNFKAILNLHNNSSNLPTTEWQICRKICGQQKVTFESRPKRKTFCSLATPSLLNPLASNKISPKPSERYGISKALSTKSDNMPHKTTISSDHSIKQKLTTSRSKSTRCIEKSMQRRTNLLQIWRSGSLTVARSKLLARRRKRKRKVCSGR